MFTRQEKLTALDEIDEIVKGLKSEEAINALDLHFSNTADSAIKAHYLIRKSRELWAIGREDEALEILRYCASEYSNADFILAQLGEYLVESSLYNEAIPHLTKVICIEEENARTWFSGAAITLRAYSYAKIGDWAKAEADYLLLQEGEEDVTWINADPPATKKSIAKMIEKGKNK